jgi:hypothetical protein
VSTTRRLLRFGDALADEHAAHQRWGLQQRRAAYANRRERQIQGDGHLIVALAAEKLAQLRFGIAPAAANDTLAQQQGKQPHRAHLHAAAPCARLQHIPTRHHIGGQAQARAVGVHRAVTRAHLHRRLNPLARTVGEAVYLQAVDDRRAFTGLYLHL